MQDIYCQGCYSRKFGTAGYRGNQSSNWFDAESNTKMRYNTANIGETTALIKAEGPDACVRCSGKVRMVEKSLYEVTCKSPDLRRTFQKVYGFNEELLFTGSINAN